MRRLRGKDTKNYYEKVICLHIFAPIDKDLIILGAK
jgi:hypothetical protein